jgi:hypothetical protein
MSAVESHIPVQLRQMAAREKSLLGEIAAAAAELQRVDCLDEEQRAEVHAILEAMRHDSESHAAIVEVLAGRFGQEAYRA